MNQGQTLRLSSYNGGFYMNRRIYITAAVLLSLLCLFSVYQVYRHYDDEKQHNEEFAVLADVVQQIQDKSNVEMVVPADVSGDIETLLPDYEALFQQNNDLTGWITIDGTTINYPVMQTPDNPDFYLKHNFEKEYSDYGIPYVAEHCDMALPSDNIIIYAHHIRGGKMFGALMDYTNQAFYESHHIIRFDTLTERSEYEIIAVFKTTVYDDIGFKYYLFADAETETDFTAYVDECKNLALYDTGVTVKYGDKLITLSTCEYSKTNGRLVIVAKKVME